MTDLEDRLRSDLPRLAELIADAPGGSFATLDAPRDGSRGRGRAIATAVAVFLIVGGLTTAVVRSRHQQAPASTHVVGLRGGWRALPPSPLGPRANAVAVWTGHDVLVWGGFRGTNTVPLAFQSGAAYNPATNSWRRIADNRWAHPGALGVWAADRLFILAKNSGAVYDPAANTWQDLARLPGETGAGFLATAEGDGSVYGIVGVVQGRSIAAARYDNSRHEWHVGRSLRVSWRYDLHDASTAWVGTELFVSDGSGAVWAYNPTADSWRVITGLTPNATASSLTSIGGALVVAYNEQGSLHAARLVGHSWQTVADAAQTRVTEPIAISAGGSLVVVDRSSGGVAVADPSTRRWTALVGFPLRPGADRAAVWAGSGLFVWGGQPPGTPATFPDPTPGAPDAAWHER